MARDPELQKLIDEAKVSKARKDASDQATETIRGEAKNMLALIQDEQAKALKPVFEELGKGLVGKIGDAIAAAIKGLKVDVPASEAPVVNMPDFPTFPEMKAPVVNVPAPIINVPAPIVHVAPTPISFPSEMSLKKGARPFPVIMTDQAGKPMQFPQASMGASGGKADFFTVVGITNSVGVVFLDSNGIAYSGSNPVPTTATISLPSGQGDAATATRVVVAGNSDMSVVVNSGTITTVTTVTGITNTVNVRLDSPDGPYSAANPLPTTATISLPSGQGDAATATRMVIAGNSDASVVVNSGTITTVTAVTNITNSVAVVALDRDGNPLTTGPIAQGDAATALRVVLAGNADASVVVNSGTITTVTAVTNITNSIASALVDSGGVQYSGSNPLPTTATLSTPQGQGDAATAMRVVIAGNSDASVVVNSGTITTVTTVTGITNTVNVRLDSPDGIISTANPLAVTLVSGALTSTLAVGDSAARAADNGGNPVKVGGIARSTNPTKYADGDRANFATDLLGRQVVRTLQARDLIATAYVTLSTGTEATLLAAGAGTYLDLISVIAANTSSAAQQLDIRCTLAGNIVQTLYIPANATAGWTPPVPWPQDATGNTWSVDMADVTNSNILISALFSKEV